MSDGRPVTVLVPACARCRKVYCVCHFAVTPGAGLCYGRAAARVRVPADSPAAGYFRHAPKGGRQ